VRGPGPVPVGAGPWSAQEHGKRQHQQAKGIGQWSVSGSDESDSGLGGASGSQPGLECVTGQVVVGAGRLGQDLRRRRFNGGCYVRY